ncbi:unnamed protein product [Rotaria socialis]
MDSDSDETLSDENDNSISSDELERSDSEDDDSLVEEFRQSSMDDWEWKVNNSPQVEHTRSYTTVNRRIWPYYMAPYYDLNIPANATWKQSGVTIAGGHRDGRATNQLYHPRGLFVDDDQTVVIADYYNDRIMQWKNGDTANGQVVAGGKGRGNGLHQLNLPTDLLIDKETDSLIICD